MSFCIVYNVVSENHNVQIPLGRGLYAAYSLYYLFRHRRCLGVEMKKKVSDRQYDLRVKGQGQQNQTLCVLRLMLALA